MARKNKLYLVDRDGVVFKQVESHDPVDMPVITGSEVKHGNATHWLKTAFELLGSVEETDILPVASISEVHVEPRYGVTLYTIHDAVPIRMGFDDYHDKLTLLAHIQKDLRNI